MKAFVILTFLFAASSSFAETWTLVCDARTPGLPTEPNRYEASSTQKNEAGVVELEIPGNDSFQSARVAGNDDGVIFITATLANGQDISAMGMTYTRLVSVQGNSFGSISCYFN